MTPYAVSSTLKMIVDSSDDGHSIPPSDSHTEDTCDMLNSAYAHTREFLDLINRLHNTGVQGDVDLPVIAVVGSQSAGKSSLIEAISGISLPRASGTCTRCPTECRLAGSKEPWKCVVTIRFNTDERGIPLGQPRIIPFGSTIVEKTGLVDRISRAQQAILNPNRDYNEFLEGGLQDLKRSRQMSFSPNLVCLEISGEGLPDLSFIDLPGLIANVGTSGNQTDIRLVRELVESYISKPSCIILLTVTMETEFENQAAPGLARRHDPAGERTIGVLTKPDRIPQTEEMGWLRYLCDEVEPLENHWYCVKQPDSQSLNAGITQERARTEEHTFFKNTSPWSSLEWPFSGRLQTRNLVRNLGSILSQLISKRLPELDEELGDLIEVTKESLEELPKPMSEDAVGDLLDLLHQFARDISAHVLGTPSEDGLLQRYRPEVTNFRREIFGTIPDFRPWVKSPLYENQKSSLPDFLLVEEQAFDMASAANLTAKTSNGKKPATSKHEGIFLDEVMRRAQKSITRELPDNYPFVTTQHFIDAFVAQWAKPTKRLVNGVSKTITEYIMELIEEHFGQFKHGGLHRKITGIITKHIKSCTLMTLECTDWLLELERAAQTSNTRHYSEYKDKFLTHYRARRQEAMGNNILGDLRNRPYNPNAVYAASTEFQSGMSLVLSNLNKVGLPGIQPTDLARLLPPDQNEPALHIMASVSAYFQVAFQRFGDNIPLAIDQGLVRGLENGLEKALRDGIDFGSPDVVARCQSLLQEPPDVISHRNELKKKVERLVSARQELSNAWSFE